MISENKVQLSLCNGDNIYHLKLGNGVVEEINDDEVSIRFKDRGLSRFNISNTINKYYFKYDENGICIFNDELIKCMPLKKDIIVDVNKINERAFENNNILQRIYLRNVQIVDRSAFRNCSNLNSVILSKIKTINSEAFLECPRLNEIFIPKSLRSISFDAFDKKIILLCKNPDVNETLVAAGYKNVYFEKNNKRQKSKIKSLKIERTELADLIVKDQTIETNKKVVKTVKYTAVIATVLLSLLFVFRTNLSNYISMSRTGKIEFSNGYYTGDLSFGNISGEGKFVYDDSSYFDGVFKNKKIVDGTYYKYYDDSVLTIVYEDAEPISYAVNNIGDKGKADGTGYSGTFENDLAYVSYKNGDNYYGEISNGERSGNGTYNFINGDSYTGSWAANKPNGNGTYKNKELIISGFFVDGVIENGNITIESESLKYSIDVKNREIEDTIKVSSPSLTYSGSYNNKGELTGDCSISFVDGDSYSGKIKDGVISGYGAYEWKNGEKYEGYFKDGKMQGNGTYYFGTTQRLSGYFYDNAPTGSCYYYTYDETRYVTYWSGGKMTSIYKG